MPRKPITVLVVDDEEKIRRCARLLLEEDGKVRVVGEAENGESATLMARALSPDVIVMDISMPVMNGLEAARTIHREFPDTPIIMTTAMGADPYRKVSLALGAWDFLDKSALDADLVSKVHNAARHGLQ
jgi:DNA-binding NarL/FixJ family response regulator